MRVTRILHGRKLHSAKFERLTEIAERLGMLRVEVWDRYGSVNGMMTDHRQIRDQWIAEGREFNVPARMWKETLRDAMADIKASREAAKYFVRKEIYRHTEDEQEQKQLFIRLKYDEWRGDNFLHRMMRKYWRRGHSRMANQLVLDKQCYTSIIRNGQVWIKVQSLQRGKRIAIPLDTDIKPSGTIRLILNEGQAAVHYTIPAEDPKPCGTETVAVDKGYTNAFVDDDNERYGEGLGEVLSRESDYLKSKYQRRSKLRAIAEKKPQKGEKIRENNLGRQKLDHRKTRHTASVRDFIHKAVHKIVDKARKIGAEDLAAQFRSRKNYSKNQRRRLAGWVKGLMAEALANISHRRGSTVVLVNAAYTSQSDSRNGLLLGIRKGARFHCFDGVVLDAEQNAALNLKARMYDSEINLWTSHQKVKAILLERTRQRLVLINPDSSCSFN